MDAARLLGIAQAIVANSTAPEAADFDAAKWLVLWRIAADTRRYAADDVGVDPGGAGQRADRGGGARVDAGGDRAAV
jgi:hypothetical protein